MTATKTIRRFFILLFITTTGMFYLSTVGKVPAQTGQLQEETSDEVIVSRTSSTEYIFFESVSRFFVAAIYK
jgi:hypothetical protein